MSLWQIIKDVLLTGTGLALIWGQVFSPHPSDLLLVTGLALTVPSVAGHAKDLLSGSGGQHSSPQPQHLPPPHSLQPAG